MRRFILSVISLAGLLCSVGAANAAGYGTAGCGLGSMFLGKKKGFMQVIAATFNATSGSQTFGITTGTSNCADSKTSAAVMKQQDFIANNLAPLSKEMAQGNGDTLTAFTETLGCDSSIGSAVKENLQKSHVKIFSSPGAIAVLESAKAELRSHPSIVQGCSWI